jgi:hypothetical protein
VINLGRGGHPRPTPGPSEGCCPSGREARAKIVGFDPKCYPKCYPEYRRKPQILLDSHFGRQRGRRAELISSTTSVAPCSPATHWTATIRISQEARVRCSFCRGSEHRADWSVNPILPDSGGGMATTGPASFRALVLVPTIRELRAADLFTLRRLKPDPVPGI